MKFYNDAQCDEKIKAKAQSYLDKGCVIEVVYEWGPGDVLRVRDVLAINPDIVHNFDGRLGFLVPESFPGKKEVTDRGLCYFPDEKEMERFILPTI